MARAAHRRRPLRTACSAEVLEDRTLLAAQILSVDAPDTVPAGQDFTVTVLLSTQNADGELEEINSGGMSLNVFFNSEVLQLNAAASDYFRTSSIFPGAGPGAQLQAFEEGAGADDDASTDRVIPLSWLDITQGWPGFNGLDQPLEILSAVFTADADFRGETTINFTGQPGAPTFNTLIIDPDSVDVDVQDPPVADPPVVIDPIENNPVLQPPIFAGADDIVIDLTQHFDHEDGAAALTFTVEPTEAGDPPVVTATIDGTNLVLSIGEEPGGPFTFTVTATDQFDQSVQDAFTIEVVELVSLVSVVGPVDPVEPGADAVFTIQVSPPAEETVIILVQTIDGTARANVDFQPLAVGGLAAVAVIPAGQSSVQIRVPTFEDRGAEQDRTFTLELIDVLRGDVILDQTTAQATILADDPDVVVPPDRGQLTIDNSEAGFSLVGNWHFTTGQGFQNDVHFAPPGTGALQATWSFTGLPDGEYDVFATWSAHPNRATNTPYTILDGTTVIDTVRVNQELTPRADSQLGPGSFQLLGTVTITSGTLNVRMTNDANEWVIADAIRIEGFGIGEVVEPDRGIYIDDNETGFSVTGKWDVATGQGFRNDVHFAPAGAGNRHANWSFTGLEDGVYEVAATWSAHPNRATNAPYTVFDGNQTLDTIRVNQEQSPGDFTAEGVGWRVLGTFEIVSGTLNVRLTNDANEFVIADGIRIERIDDVNDVEPPPDAVADDLFPDSVAQVTLNVPGVGDVPLTLTGLTDIQTTFAGPNVGDAADLDGLGFDAVLTEVMDLDLAGTHPEVGDVTVQLSPTLASFGEIHEDVNVTPGRLDVPPFTATGTGMSFFDVFAQFNIPGFGTLHNVDPFQLDGIVTGSPTGVGDVLGMVGGPVQLFNAAGQPTGITVTNIQHTLSPIPADPPTATGTNGTSDTLAELDDAFAELAEEGLLV